MKTFYRNSIQSTYCQLTMENYLKMFKKSVSFNQIPLYSFKSYKSQNLVYCKESYLNMDPNQDSFMLQRF